MSAAPVTQVTKNPDGTTVTMQPVPGYGVSARGSGTGEMLPMARPITRMSGVKIIVPKGQTTSGKSAYS